MPFDFGHCIHRANEEPPQFDNFECLVNRGTSGWKRICVYIRKNIPFKTIYYSESSLPCIVIQTCDTTFGWVYSEFTKEAYTTNKERLTENIRVNILLDFLRWFGHIGGKKAVLLGDMNVDWSANTISKRKILNWAKEDNFQQIQRKATRSCTLANGHKSNTCLDHIYVRNLTESNDLVKHACGVFDPAISDHHGIYINIARKKQTSTESKYTVIKKWSFTPQLRDFARENKLPLDSINCSLSSAVNNLTDWVKDIDKLAWSSKRIKTKPNTIPWYSKELLTLKSMINQASTDALRKKARNKYVREVRKKKKKYVRSQISRNINKGVWGVVGNKNKSANGSEIPNLVIEGKEIVSLQDKANAFKAHFENKSKSLQKEPDLDEVLELLKDKYNEAEQWDLKPFNCCEIAQMIDRLPPKNSKGPDGLSCRLLKELKWEIVLPLTSIINQSILEGTFPEQWKVSRTIPIYKGKGDRSDVKSYRPISLTSPLAKVFESCVRTTLQKYTCHLLPKTMFGYRSGLGTSDAVVFLTDTIKEHRAKGEKVILITLDASGAFDLVSRKLIIESLKALGAGPFIINWIMSYLSDRIQYIQLDDTKSESWCVEVGVIQGGILSPDLFNIATITQSFWCEDSDSLAYADDGGHVVADLSTDECIKKAEYVCERMAQWYDKVGLTMNAKKTEIVCFGCHVNEILVKGELIKPSNKIKFLGAYIEKDLGWKAQVKYVADKVRFAAANIRKQSTGTNLKERIILYNGWVKGNVMANGLAYLPCLTNDQLKDMQTAMNASIRAILRLPKYGHLPMSEYRAMLGLESIETIRDKIVAVEAWKRRQNLVNLLATEGRATRSRNKLNIPAPDQKGWRGKMVSTKVQKMWNTLPLAIKKNDIMASAKSQINEFFNL